jgi:hypothetical protein
VVSHPVLLLTRWDTTNAFHSLEVRRFVRRERPLALLARACH